MTWDGTILQMFDDEQVNVSLYTITQAPDATGEWVETATLAGILRGLMWARSITAKYFNVDWAEDVRQIFCTADKGSLDSYSEIGYNGDMYQVLTIEDIAEQNGLYLIGLGFKR